MLVLTEKNDLCRHNVRKRERSPLIMSWMVVAIEAFYNFFGPFYSKISCLGRVQFSHTWSGRRKQPAKHLKFYYTWIKGGKTTDGEKNDGALYHLLSLWGYRYWADTRFPSISHTKEWRRRLISWVSLNAISPIERRRVSFFFCVSDFLSPHHFFQSRWELKRDPIERIQATGNLVLLAKSFLLSSLDNRPSVCLSVYLFHAEGSFMTNDLIETYFCRFNVSSRFSPTTNLSP